LKASRKESNDSIIKSREEVIMRYFLIEKSLEKFLRLQKYMNFYLYFTSRWYLFVFVPFQIVLFTVLCTFSELPSCF